MGGVLLEDGCCLMFCDADARRVREGVRVGCQECGEVMAERATWPPYYGPEYVVGVAGMAPFAVTTSLFFLFCGFFLFLFFICFVVAVQHFILLSFFHRPLHLCLSFSSSSTSASFCIVLKNPLLAFLPRAYAGFLPSYCIVCLFPCSLPSLELPLDCLFSFSLAHPFRSQRRSGDSIVAFCLPSCCDYCETFLLPRPLSSFPFSSFSLSLSLVPRPSPPFPVLPSFFFLPSPYFPLTLPHPPSHYPHRVRP